MTKFTAKIVNVLNYASLCIFHISPRLILCVKINISISLVYYFVFFKMATLYVYISIICKCHFIFLAFIIVQLMGFIMTFHTCIYYMLIIFNSLLYILFSPQCSPSSTFKPLFYLHVLSLLFSFSLIIDTLMHTY